MLSELVSAAIWLAIRSSGEPGAPGRDEQPPRQCCRQAFRGGQTAANRLCDWHINQEPVATALLPSRTRNGPIGPFHEGKWRRRADSNR